MNSMEEILMRYITEENAKLKRVIDIIKTKKVSTTLLWNSNDDDVDDYNLYEQERYCLTEEEYKLLKEVLGNE